ncbi:MAG TPA: PH domain-containing protein [Candidatus Saccharimonadales bacterium]|nr:PH domain-containing protein [Candidatus Saccharimonadales bacterium]
MEPNNPNPEQLQPQQMPAQPDNQPPSYERPEEKGMHPMVVLQPGERIVATLKRHPFGILSLYIGGVIGLTVAAVLAFALLPHVVQQYNSSGNALMYMYAAFGVFVIGLVLILGIATAVYWQNQWVITTDSITQISQRSLFGRQVSQLSMDNLEDVTVDQDGIIPHLFNFGTLKVETAGERSKFQFPYCPRPNDYARQILEVHEQFLEERRNIQNRP